MRCAKEDENTKVDKYWDRNQPKLYGDDLSESRNVWGSQSDSRGANPLEKLHSHNFTEESAANRRIPQSDINMMNPTFLYRPPSALFHIHEN
jgi:hypothetical protein